MENQTITFSSTDFDRQVTTLYMGRLTSSPIGPIWIAVSGLGIIVLDWDKTQSEFTHLIQRHHPVEVVKDDSYTAEYLRQISEYLDGKRRQFTFPLDLTGLTPFQTQALHHTLEIPYGQTRTYQQIALVMGKPKAARAVGRAEATNPIPLVIPCHRVLGTDGTLHGYGGPGGIKLKAWLLKLESGSEII